MTDEWFYSKGTDRIGPLSSRQLKNLADAGQILPGDTIWKQGIERSVAARQVKHLFALVAPPVVTAPIPVPVVTPLQPVESIAPVIPPVTPAVPKVEPPRVKQHDQPRKGRAIAGPGVTILSQDGSYVSFKKKCTVCSHEDTNRNRLKITNGVTRVGFFCPKCRKLRNGEIRGQMN